MVQCPFQSAATGEVFCCRASAGKYNYTQLTTNTQTSLKRPSKTSIATALQPNSNHIAHTQPAHGSESVRISIEWIARVSPRDHTIRSLQTTTSARVNRAPRTHGLPELPQETPISTGQRLRNNHWYGRTQYGR
ncbi:hypothetical protein RR46_00592 [Papilio xuthus]|uniref:Uncharacterized protein n=1 Tax=Papilio xuthus TaxID=66420 RepID=A0A0N0PAD9_PAPXU|nr:hypothetical protein RR46_00592 [Papilio xuthus]